MNREDAAIAAAIAAVEAANAAAAALYDTVDRDVGRGRGR